MSPAQHLRERLATQQGKKPGGMPNDPIGCYTPLLMLALTGLFALHVFLATLLPRVNLTALLPALNALFAALYGWALSGLSVCLLLYLWLKVKYAAVVVTLVLAILWVAGLARYAQGEGPLPLAGGVIFLLSIVAGSAVFLLGLYVASGFLLPFPDKRHRGKVFNFLRDYTMRVNFPSYVVVDEPYEEDKVKERIHGNPFTFLATGPGIVLSDCDHAVAISAGVKFKGVQGPGVTFTGFGDQVIRTIDLRPQLRTFHMEALTKDGIKIRVLVFVPFRIDARGRQPTLGEHLPYNKSAAHRAFLAQRMEHEGEGQIPERMKQRAWDDLPRMIAERILRNIISQYNFDDLYGLYQAGGEPPRKAITETFRNQLVAELEPLGIQLVGARASDQETLEARIGTLEPADPQVYVERACSWQADWTRRIMLRQAQGQTERLRIIERARAETRADLILSLGRQLEELSAARTELRPETVLSHFLKMLEELVMQPPLRRMLPRDTRRALGDVRKAIPE